MGSWDGPLEISGGGVTIPKKKFLQGKLVQKKILPHAQHLKLLKVWDKGGKVTLPEDKEN